MNRHRLDAAREIIALFGLWTLTVWGAWHWTGASVWTAVGFTALVVAVLRFLLIRRIDLKSSGFRVDNLARALMVVAVVTGLLLAICFAVSPSAAVFPQPFSASMALQMIASGILQQAFFLGYLLQRWSAWIQNPLLAVFLNALFFAYVHLPNLSLVLVTALAGIFFGLLFLKVPNVLAIGLAHGVLSLAAGPLLESWGALETRRIGPAELAPFAEQIAAEWRPGGRVGIGPHAVGAEQFGRRLQAPVEFIGASDADDRFNRQRFGEFLRSKERVFCVLTEDDFRRYVDPGLRRDLAVLGERFILRRDFLRDNGVVQMFFIGDGDMAVLAAFRERVLLVSNQPPAPVPLMR
jgi:membrane protease YdiL (CAAX protease family)